MNRLEDVELQALLGLNEEALTDLLAGEYEQDRRAMRDAEARTLSYLSDLRVVLRTDGGSGVRVLRHWLDAACANDRLSGAGARLHGAAALHDYARDRMAEVVLADPVSHVRIQLEGARLWARANLAGEGPEQEPEQEPEQDRGRRMKQRPRASV